MTDSRGETYIIHYKTVDADASTNFDEDLDDPPSQPTQNQQQQQDPLLNQNKIPTQQIKHSQNFNPDNQPKVREQPVQNPIPISDDVQKQMINAFLTGEQCLNGVSI